MHPKLLRPRVATAFVVAIAALAATYASPIASAKPKHHGGKHHKHKSKFAGTWSGSYGGPYSGTFTLKWKQSGSSLSGSITLSAPAGTFSCTGHVHGGKITFGVVGAGATYKGTASGKSMSGTYKTKKGSGTWSAHKL